MVDFIPNSNNSNSTFNMNKLIEIHQFAIEQMNKWGLIEVPELILTLN